MLLLTYHGLNANTGIKINIGYNLAVKLSSLTGIKAMSELASENVRRSYPVKYLIGLLIFIALLGIGYAVYYFSYWRESPRYALWKIVRAIQANDTETLFQYIDLQSLTDNLLAKSSGDIDSLLEKKGLGVTPEEDDVSRLVRGLTKKFARFIAPKIISSLEPAIKAGLEKYLAELNTMQKAALSVIPSQAQIQQDDGMADVTIVDPTTNKPYRFRMAKLNDSNQWRIVEINYDDFRNFIEKKFIE
jgi:hypothetical protein